MPTLVALTFSSFSYERAIMSFFFDILRIIIGTYSIGAERRPALSRRFRGE